MEPLRVIPPPSAVASVGDVTLPNSIFLSSTKIVPVFIVIVSPWTVRSPLTTKLFVTVVFILSTVTLVVRDCVAVPVVVGSDVLKCILLPEPVPVPKPDCNIKSLPATSVTAASQFAGRRPIPTSAYKVPLLVIVLPLGDISKNGFDRLLIIVSVALAVP